MKPDLIHSRHLQHTRCYYTTPDQAAPRNLTRELLQTLSGYRQTGQGFFDLESQLQPQYSRLNLDNSAQNLYGFDDAQGVHHPGTLEMGRSSTAYQRAGDVSDVQDLGPAATEALLRSNPYLARGLESLFARTNDSPILRTLNQQAESALATGGNLTPEEERAAEQQTRQIFSDRGTLGGNTALGAEILNRDAARRARIQQAQSLASGVQGLNQAQNDFTGRATQIAGTQLGDPFLSILGRSSGAGGGSGSGGQNIIGTGSRIFDPMNPYASDIYNTNYNAEASHNIAAANAQNANTSTAITGITTLLGGLLSDRRLKKKVKDTGRKTKEGIPIKSFEYKTRPGVEFEGVMAQDTEKIRPDLVRTDPLSGVKVVDYWGLGMEMKEAA